eukprot:CFRG5348T1
MCITFFSFRPHLSPGERNNSQIGYRLVMAFNRDEFYQRPTAKADFWTKKPGSNERLNNETMVNASEAQIIGGMDMQSGREGGTWLAMNTAGKLGLLTNYRVPVEDIRQDSCGRGHFIPEYLNGVDSSETFFKAIDKRKTDYAFFNMICAKITKETTEMVYYTNSEPLGISRLPSGTYSLSNKVLDSPWPKQLTGRLMFQEILNKHRGEPVTAETKKVLEEELLVLMGDTTLYAEEDELPQTGVSAYMEKAMGSIFGTLKVNNLDYGTRTTTFVLVDDNNVATWIEYTRPDVCQDVDEKHSDDHHRLVPPQIARGWIRSEKTFPLHLPE